MYDRSLFLKLNNYGYKDESVEEVKDYIVNLKCKSKKIQWKVESVWD